MSKILATSDLHLALSTPSKDMEKFGEPWINYLQKIENGWKSAVGRNDIIIIAGDISWATRIEEARKDFDFIEALPGKKIVTIGNHDYYHQTSTKTHNFLFYNYKTIVPLVRNDYINLYDNIAICAVRGYMNENHPEFKEEYRRSYNRECRRLENTLKSIPSTFDNIVVASHYPPLHKGYADRPNKVMKIMSKYKVKKCIYGHLHSEDAKEAFVGPSGNIDFVFVAGDSHDFVPLPIMKME